jgi:Arc/MetJ-type ribon-helix-helix transcriptional regulator
MKRTTVTLPESYAELLNREARRRGTSVSEVVREALAAYLGVSSDKPRRLPFADLGNSGYRHTARDVEEILAEEWGRARDR